MVSQTGNPSDERPSPKGGKGAGDPVPGVANKWKPRLELQCEKLESHRPRCRGSSKDKTSDARRIRPAQDKATTNHPILPALNPSSKVAACLVAPTRMARPEVRIYTRRVALRRSGATVCRPVGRLSKQKSGAVTGKLASRQAQPIQPERAQDHTIFSAPSVAVGGERAATSVRRLLNPARSLENSPSAYSVAFSRSQSSQAVSFA